MLKVWSLRAELWLKYLKALLQSRKLPWIFAVATMFASVSLQASGLRRARTYRHTERAERVYEDYPVGCSAFLDTIHDARYYQGILSNEQNFSRETGCEIFEVRGTTSQWLRTSDEVQVIRSFEVLPIFLELPTQRSTDCRVLHLTITLLFGSCKSSRLLL